MVKVIVLLLIFFSLSCRESPYLKENKYKNISQKKWRHPNGLVLRVAEILPVEQTKDGFDVYPENIGEPKHSGVSVSLREVEARDGFEKTIQVSEAEEIERIGNRKIYYEQKVEELGGNGGRSKYEFSASELFDSRQNPDKKIFVRYFQTTLAGSLGFQLSWHVVEGTSYEK